MGTNIRPEVSKKRDYYIPKHRYYELKHFCLQYPEWKQQVRDCARLGSTAKLVRSNPEWSDPTYSAVEHLEGARRKIRLVEECSRLAAEDLACYILKAVTEGASYVQLRMMDEIPCGRSTFYELYRRFYYILSVRK